MKEILEYNGKTELTETTYAGKIYEALGKLKTKFSGNSIKNILTSCDSREAATLHIYQQAMKKTFNVQLARLIENHALSLKSSHEAISIYRQAYIKLDKMYS
jgi:hypothetical protein